MLDFSSIEELERLWAGARETGIEGLMLKRRDSPYLAGRPKGHWYKWKRGAAHPRRRADVCAARQRQALVLSIPTIRSAPGARSEAGEPELVPVGKAYFGFTDEELRQLDASCAITPWIASVPCARSSRSSCSRSPSTAVHRSSRHKSGVAMRFPRIHRIRWDKPAEEADRLETLMGMIVE